MKAKRKQAPGPEPVPEDDPDTWRAKWFGWRLRQLGVTTDGLAAASGVSRTAVLSLAGSGGAAPQTTWSTASRPTVERLWATLQLVWPVPLQELRELLKIPRDHAPATWAEPQALAGEVFETLCSSAPLRVRWDVAGLTGPQLFRDAEGHLQVAESVPTGCVRLGALRDITPG